MQKTITLHTKNINYTLKTSRRAKRMRIAVYCDGSLTVTMPTAMHQGTVEKFLMQKAQWILDSIQYFQSSNQIFFPRKNTKAEYKKYKDAAQMLAERKIAEFNTLYKYQFQKINIKNQKTRWGSCSRKGNLNFNYKIVLLPEKMADYIIVHELCHLKEFNHSQKFWHLVAKAVPDYLNIRKELKSNALR